MPSCILLYARFFHKLMRDVGLVDSDEPFTRLLTQGMVLKDGSKMSKSKGNTVDPQDLIDKHGADTVRLFTMFASPPDQALEWNDDAVAGGHRFLKRWWYLVHNNIDALTGAAKILRAQDWATKISDKTATDLRRATHTLLEKADRDYGRLQYNTVIAGMMELLNALDKIDPAANEDCATAFREGLVVLTKVLAPITPHIAHTLWKTLGESGDVIDATWPIVDKNALVSDTLTLAIQVNGKLRSQIEVAADASKESIEEMAKADAKVQNHIAGKAIRKLIVVPGRLVNIVV